MKISHFLVTIVILNQTFHLIILRAKFYIYTCKINKNILQLYLFKRYLKNTFDVGKHNAMLTIAR